MAYVYGVQVEDRDHYYVQQIADLLYPYVPEDVRKNDKKTLVRQELAKLAMKTLADARGVGRGPLLK